MRNQPMSGMLGALALAVSAVILIVLPGGYGLACFAAIVNDLDFKARLNAEQVASYLHAAPSPASLPDRTTLAFLLSLPAVDGSPVRQTVTMPSGSVTVQQDLELETPVLAKEAPILLQGRNLGTVTIETSLRPVIIAIGKMALAAFLLAAAAYGTFHRWPRRTIARAHRALRESHVRTVKALVELEQYDEQLRARTDQLYAAQEIGRIGDWTLTLGSGDMTISPVAISLLRLDLTDVELNGFTIGKMLEDDGVSRFEELMRAVVRTRNTVKMDLRFRRGDGSVADLAVIARAAETVNDRVTRIAGTIQDVSERKEAERQLEKLAYFDPLTGLANRTLFKRELSAEIQRAEYDGQPAALLLIDLDRFKEVNDSLGHATGDELLTKAARLIVQLTANDSFVARLGGDEFAIIVRGEETARVEDLARSIVDTLARPIALGRGEVVIGASIGIVRIPLDGDDTEEITKNADLALYRSKDMGRGRYAFFNREMNELIQHKVALARDLRAATASGQNLEVWFQPQFNLTDGSVVGFEALMRWKHPVRGYIPPSEFIPIAESSSLICDIGLWILRETARITKAWIDAGGAPYEVAVNLSAAQIWQTDIEADVATVLRETGLQPDLLCLELTESLFADHAENRVRKALTGLKALGVQLALDDFGTGYSSLGYLAQLPFDKLKVDRLFIAAAARSDKSHHILKGIIGLGHGLGMTVVAEGIERPQELARLQEFGCDFGQGFLFAQPEPAADALLAMANLPDMLRSAKPLIRPRVREQQTVA